MRCILELYLPTKRGGDRVEPCTGGAESWSLLFMLHRGKKDTKRGAGCHDQASQAGTTRLLLAGLVQQHIYFLANRHGAPKE